MSLDLEETDLGVSEDHVSNLEQERIARLEDFRAIGRKVDLASDRDLLPAKLRESTTGARDEGDLPLGRLICGDDQLVGFDEEVLGLDADLIGSGLKPLGANDGFDAGAERAIFWTADFDVRARDAGATFVDDAERQVSNARFGDELTAHLDDARLIGAGRFGSLSFSERCLFGRIQSRRALFTLGDFGAARPRLIIRMLDAHFDEARLEEIALEASVLRDERSQLAPRKADDRAIDGVFRSRFDHKPVD